MPFLTANISTANWYANATNVGTSCTLSFAAAPPKGTFLIAVFSYNGGSQTMTTPSGWTLAANRDFSTSTRSVVTYVKWSDGNETTLTGATTAATGVAGVAIGLTGISPHKNGLTALVTANTGTNVGTNVVGWNFGSTTSPNTDFSSFEDGPCLVVGSCGANASLSAVGWTAYMGSGTVTGDSKVIYSTGAANGSSAAVALLGVSGNSTSPRWAAPYWTNTSVASRTGASTAFVLRPVSGTLTSIGMGS